MPCEFPTVFHTVPSHACSRIPALEVGTHCGPVAELHWHSLTQHRFPFAYAHFTATGVWNSKSIHTSCGSKRFSCLYPVTGMGKASQLSITVYARAQALCMCVCVYACVTTHRVEVSMTSLHHRLGPTDNRTCSLDNLDYDHCSSLSQRRDQLSGYTERQSKVSSLLQQASIQD